MFVGEGCCVPCLANRDSQRAKEPEAADAPGAIHAPVYTHALKLNQLAVLFAPELVALNCESKHGNQLKIKKSALANGRWWRALTWS